MLQLHRYFKESHSQYLPSDTSASVSPRSLSSPGAVAAAPAASDGPESLWLVIGNTFLTGAARAPFGALGAQLLAKWGRECAKRRGRGRVASRGSHAAQMNPVGLGALERGSSDPTCARRGAGGTAHGQGSRILNILKKSSLELEEMRNVASIQTVSLKPLPCYKVPVSPGPSPC